MLLLTIDDSALSSSIHDDYCKRITYFSCPVAYSKQGKSMALSLGD